MRKAQRINEGVDVRVQVGRQHTLKIPKGVPVPPGANMLLGRGDKRATSLLGFPWERARALPGHLHPALTSEGSIEDLASSATKLYHSRAEEQSTGGTEGL